MSATSLDQAADQQLQKFRKLGSNVFFTYSRTIDSAVHAIKTQISWRSDLVFVGSSYGLPEKIDGCKVEVLWAKVRMPGASSEQLLGNGTLVGEMKPMDVLLSAVSADTRVSTSLYAPIYAAKDSGLTMAWANRLWQNGTDSALGIAGGTARGCRIHSDGVKAIICNRVTFDSDDYATLEFAGGWDTPSNRYEWNCRRDNRARMAISDYRNMETAFDDRGRVVGIKVDRLPLFRAFIDACDPRSTPDSLGEVLDYLRVQDPSSHSGNRRALSSAERSEALRTGWIVLKTR